MENFSLSPENFSKVLKFLVGDSRQIPVSWKCPIKMSHNPSGELIIFDANEQTSSMMAVLQAYAFVVRKFYPSLEGRKLLVSVIIHIIKLIRGQNFIFCTGFSSDGTGYFTSSNTEDVVHKYLIESTFLDSPQAVLLLALSFCTVAGPAKLSSPHRKIPFLSSEGYASINFILFLLTGFPADSPSSIFQIENGSMRIPVHTQQQVGLIDADSNSQYNIGTTLLVPKDKVWVVINKNYYTTVLCSNDVYFEYNVSAIEGFKVNTIPDDNNLIIRIKEALSKKQ